MRARYIWGAVGFYLGLAIALLVTSLMQSRSGNTYQVIRGGLPSEIYTASWNLSATNMVLVIFCLAGMLLVSPSGSEREKRMNRTPSKMPWWVDFFLVILMIVLASSRNLFPPLGIDLAQVGLVVIAVAFGPGPGFLVGITGLVLGTSMANGEPWLWLIVVAAAAGGLAGALTGILAGGLKPLRLLAALIVAAAFGLVPYLFMDIFLAPVFNSTWIRLVSDAAIPMLLNTAAGLVLGVILRLAWTRKILDEPAAG